MSLSSKIDSKIDANDITLSGILDRQKFSIDYFQREYRWERKHIEQLIDDFSTSFLNSYAPEQAREEVEEYNSYYMGPVVMSSKEGKYSIIDGQQRLTSLTLLLIYLHNRQKDLTPFEPVETLIFSEKFSKKSYNMQVEEREKCLNALFTLGKYEAYEEDDSVKNLVSRYNDIVEIFPEEIDEKALPYFVSWLKEKLIFVKIVTYSEDNAYTIFETMNDRGLNLTATEMLKGYLLSKMKVHAKKNELNTLWKKRIAELHELSVQEDQEFIKAWLRAKYADSIRPGKKGASNEDFEKIGTTFHTWVKDKTRLIGLEKESDFIALVENEFSFYSTLYLRILNAQFEQTKGLESLLFTAWYGIADSLALPLLMASINEDDREEIQNKKLQLVAHFIDCFTVYRSINQRTLGQSSLRYTIFSLVKEIRNKDASELVDILKRKVSEIDEGLDGIYTFTLNQQNKRFVRFFLGRLTNFIENESGINSYFDDYMSDEIKKPAQIEHIWADIYENHRDEFDQKSDFTWLRNTLGNLILLPKGTNQSFNKDSFEKKLPHYLKQNLLAQTLHHDCYVKNPNFINWYKNEEIQFQPVTSFKRKDLNDRTRLYHQIAKKIWSVKRFDDIAG